MKIAGLSIVFVALLAGCSGSEPEVLAGLKEVDAPAGQHSGQPNLSVGPNGEIYLSWIETTDAGMKTARFATRASGNWSEPRTIVESDNLLVNWADFPSLFALSGGGLAAHWLSTIPERGGYDVHVAFSQDQGATWSAAVTPHRDGTPTEHGFVSLAAANGGVSVIWLDGRKLAGDSDHVALMSTKVGADGAIGDEAEIDPRVCECCQPSSIPVDGGILTVFRDRSDTEIRDIAITRFDGNQWSPPKTVFEDNWQIYACPIQGPAISAAGGNVAVAWFTAANDIPKVQVALSTDGGNTFGSAVQVDDGKPIGRVDVAALESGGAVVTWIEHATTGGEVRAKQIRSNGQPLDPVTLAGTSVGSSSGFPRVRRSGNVLVFAWTDAAEHRVRTAVAGE